MKLKNAVKKHKLDAHDALLSRITQAVYRMTPDNCKGWLRLSTSFPMVQQEESMSQNLFFLSLCEIIRKKQYSLHKRFRHVEFVLREVYDSVYNGVSRTINAISKIHSHRVYIIT